LAKVGREVVGEAGVEPEEQLGLDEFELEHDKPVVVVTDDVDAGVGRHGDRLYLYV
jgi:hypothetical protein